MSVVFKASWLVVDVWDMAPVHPTLALDRPIRSARRVWFFAGSLWLFATSMFLMSVIAARGVNREGLLGAIGVVGLFGGMGLPAIWGALRIQRVELRITARSVIVRNPFRCHTVALSDVEEFQAGNATPNATNGTPGIVLCLKSGQDLPVWALAEESTIFSTKKRILSFRPLAEELNALLVTARASPGRRPSDPTLGG